MRTLNLLFKMPKDDELFVAAWAAISEYERILRDKKIPIQTTLIAEDNWLENILIPATVFVTDNINNVKGMEFDIIVDMEDERATDLGKYSRTAACAYGAILGLHDVPELVKLVKPVEASHDICILFWDQESAFLVNKINRQWPLLTVAAVSQDDPTAADTAMKSRLVFGQRSLATYLAACSHRIVLEGYTLYNYSKDFLAKWSNPRYSMICVENEEALNKNHPIIWRSLERLINSLQKSLRKSEVANVV